MSAVLTELPDGVLTDTLNRPERLNAINAELVQDLRTLALRRSSNGRVP